jgi:general secretion pathway protein M
MSTEVLKAPASPSDGSLKGQAITFWRGRSLRERQALGAGLVALVAVLIWLTLVQPAWRTLREAPAQLDEIDRQLQQIRVTAGEVTALRSVAPVSPLQAAAALKAATDRLGAQGRLSLQGDRASLTLTNVASDDLYDWLMDARSTARSRPIEASLSRTKQGYSGTIVVTLGGSS